MNKAYLSNIEQHILAVLQEGFPKTKRPYKDMAQKIGVDTKTLLGVLKTWEQEGKLRRIGAILNHFKVGLTAGAMVVWQVEPEQVERVGQMLAAFEEISHAYERETEESWPYNLYSMVHGTDSESVQEVVKKISKTCGISKYRILVTEKELKKVPPTYITKSKS